MERPISPSAGRTHHFDEGAFSHLLASGQDRRRLETVRSPPHTAARGEDGASHDGAEQGSHRPGRETDGALPVAAAAAGGAEEAGSWAPVRQENGTNLGDVRRHEQAHGGARLSARPREESPNAVPPDLWPRRANAISRMQRPSQIAARVLPIEVIPENETEAPVRQSLNPHDAASRGRDDVTQPERRAHRERLFHREHDEGRFAQPVRRDAHDGREGTLSENASDQDRLRQFLPMVASTPTSSSQGAHQASDARGATAGRSVPQMSSSEATSGGPASARQSQSSGAGQGSLTQSISPLEGFARVRHGRRYNLIVVQHPERARMCGYGDKDRRPLSPSLIVKLVVTDEDTGMQVSPWDINTSLFFLASDLCDPDELMRAPRNLLLNTQLASIPASMLQETRSYETPRGETAAAAAAMTGNLNFASLQAGQQSAGRGPMGERYGHGISSVLRDDRASASRMSALPPPPRSSTSGLTQLAAAYEHQQQYQQQQQQQIQEQRAQTATVTTEHYARNLVGAAVTSANVLRDENDEYQIFFVLQDLSVRAEGTYRIRLLFTDLAQRQGKTNEGVSSALAEAYTEPFSVYTPRRFPGMLEPTELSKKLASQGIKIAVRSDKKKRQRDAQDEDPSRAGSSRGGRSMVGGDAAPSGQYAESVGSAQLGGDAEVDELEDDDDED